MNGSPKFQPSVVSSFGITALASKKSKITTGAYIRSHNFRLDYSTALQFGLKCSPWISTSAKV